MTNGFVQQRDCCTSTIHMIVESDTAARPAVNRTYELVHRLLLIGKTQCHMSPPIIASAPAVNNPASRSVKGCRSPIHRPAMLPSIAVVMAGIVDSTPSGSHVWLDTQR